MARDADRAGAGQGGRAGGVGLRARWSGCAAATGTRACGGWSTPARQAGQADRERRPEGGGGRGAVIDAQTDTSTGTRSPGGPADQGPAGGRARPGRGAGAVGRNVLPAAGRAVGRAAHLRLRDDPPPDGANRPGGAFTPTIAARPGEQVQMDGTPLDVMAVMDDGVTGRPELVAAVDVATRTICAAVLRPVGRQGGRRRAAAGPDDGARADAAGLGPGPGDVGVADPLPAAGQHRRPAGAGRGQAGHRPGHGGDRPRQGVLVRGVPAGRRHPRALGPAGPPADRRPTRRHGADLRVDQHAVLPARRRLHRPGRHPPRHRRRRPEPSGR